MAPAKSAITSSSVIDAECVDSVLVRAHQKTRCFFQYFHPSEPENPLAEGDVRRSTSIDPQPPEIVEVPGYVPARLGINLAPVEILKPLFHFFPLFS